MKKLNLVGPFHSDWLSKHHLKMKLTTLLLIVSLFKIQANTYGQNTKITLSLNNVSVQQVFEEIESLSDFRFLYNHKKVNLKRTVSVNVKKEPISNILDRMFEATDIYFTVKNKQIILKTGKIRKSVDPVNNPIEQHTVNGTITDADGNPLPGANIVEKGTTNGVTADFDGNFSLDVANENATLVISYIGFASKEVPLNGQSSVSISLEESAAGLDEVVLIGYGTQKKSDLTGAVGSIKSEELAERPAASLNQAMAGKVAGVNITSGSGRPGGRTVVRIRGNTSVSIANTPLYVIDGVILNAVNLPNGSTPIDYLNPNDIESIEVLKDASATAIYGARGANGVILVSTKKGTTTGETRLNYDVDFSLGTLPKKLDLLNSEEFLRVEEIAYANAEKFDPEGWAGGRYTDPRLKRTDPRLFDANGNPLYDTDWQDEAIRAALTQNHQLSFTGGNQKSNFGLFMGFRDEEGLIVESWLKRYSGRFTLDTEVTDWLRVGGSLSYNDQNEKQVDQLGGGGITTMRQVYEALPIIPVRYEDGSWGSNIDYPGMEGGGSPVAVANDRRYFLKTQTVLGNFYGNIEFNKNLQLRTTIGTSIINQRNDYYGGKDLRYIAMPDGAASVANSRYNSWQFENYLTYNKDFDSNNSITAMVGLSWQHIDEFSATASTRGFADDFYGFNNLGAGSNPQAPSSSKVAYGLNSYFGRVNYNYMNKYLLTLTGRADGSSKFGPENQFAFFPSAALAWRASEEDFLSESETISNLKIRASYGATGNSELPAYQALAGLSNGTVILDDALATYTVAGRMANPDLKWEKTEQVDAGIELGLLNNRIGLELDVYRKLTTDMLLNAPIPSSSGFTNVFRNVGSLENKGIEINLNTVNFDNDLFGWSSNFNISINKNEVIALSGGSDIFLGSTLIRVGEPLGTFFGYIDEGTWNTDEAAQAAIYDRLPGDIKYRDLNNDGAINSDDRAIIGKGIADGFGTFSNTFRYGNFELLVDLQFQYGNSVMYRDEHSAEDRQTIANSFKTVLNAWTPDNQDTDIAQIRPIAAGYDTNNDSGKLKDASFLRGRNLMLSYVFKPELVERLHLNRFRVYASVQNFFVSTKYPGYDPESSNGGGAFDQGFSLYDYPRPRTFMLGLNIGL
ncbi:MULTISPECIES: TonB-dependent receptor [unclassified Arenibacter]|uniref:TonB-dependent receptor n=1 Tax=unclassified Arenibacter TaxID=2615047 RepID=UPI000E346FF3|nr:MULTISPECIES: TonB-dependent receptor [unclassified Arenibacter]MCM4162201.1 SusC/RagA family TonB-linked outer membrane protein [Arenibacter sp. A80]RFT57810.1 SusC/RagA family TonB-linked outer membrane protein [Arenibacter sp. P308M17]